MLPSGRSAPSSTSSSSSEPIHSSPPTSAAKVNPQWGGRFSGGPSALMASINASIHIDKRLYREDIKASTAYARMLAGEKAGICTREEGEKLASALGEIEREVSAVGVDSFAGFTTAHEDIHMNVEHMLSEKLGAELAGRLHTGRSRNDQVATDMRLWLKREMCEIEGCIKSLISTLLAKAEAHVETVMPGFTHLQVAQPITLGHHLLAYVEMLGRDWGRLTDALARMDQCPLGAAALAGTSHPIDRHALAQALGFGGGPTRNSLDTVSDRDFCMEFLSAAAICAVHLSRLAEELCVWSTPQFNFIRLSDAYTTGSSIMPQKRNADAAELVRAKTARINGNLVAMLGVMKALPLAYCKDLQEDKEPVFDSVDTLKMMLRASEGMIADAEVNRGSMLAAAAHGFSTATDLADWLVRELRLPFREAHHLSGAAVKLAEREGLQRLDQLSLAQLRAEVHPRIHDGVFECLTPANSASSRVSYGGTAPVEVRRQIAYWKARMG